MKIFSKKLIASILTIIMCLSSVAFVGAEDSSAINISATETTTINTANDMLCAGGMENHNGTGNYAFCTGTTATATIDVEAAGYYTVEVTGDVRSAKCADYKLLIDEEEVDSFRVYGNNGGLYTIEVCDIYLEEGEQDLKIAYVSPASVYNYLTEIKLTKKETETDSIWILAKNGTSISGSGAAHEMFYTSVGGSVSYTVNVPEAGAYMMGMKIARVDDATNNYTVKVNGTAVKGTMGQLPQNNALTDPFNGLQLMADMCVVNLNEGNNTIEFTNNGSFMYFSYFKFDKVGDSSNDDTEPTEEPSTNKEPIGEKVRTPMKSFKNSSSLSKEDWMSFEQGNWAEYELDIPSTGYYRFGIKFGGSQGDSQGFKVYVNGTEELDATVSIEYDFFEPGDTVIGDILFTEAGTNTLKIENSASNGILVEDFYLQLVEEVVITPEPTEEPPFIPEVEPMGENIRIQSREYISAYNAATGTAELRQDGTNPDNTLWQINDWAEYALNITTPGTYEFGLCLGGNPANIQKLTASVDGVEQLIADVTIAETMGASVPKFDVVFGTITFNTAGKHTFKMKKTDGGFIYVSHIFFNLTDSSEIRVPMKNYKEAFNNNLINGKHENSEELQIEGGYVCWRPGDKATFEVNIPTPGKYTLGIKQSGADGQISKLKASVNGVEQFNNEGKTAISGGYTKFAGIEYGEVEFVFDGKNELTIENTGSSDGEYTVDLYLVLSEEIDTGADVPDVPPVTELRLHMRNDSYEKYCNLTNSDDLKIEGGCVTWHGKESSSETGDWAKFKVKIEEPGTYNFGLAVSGTVGGKTALSVYVDDELVIDNSSKSIKTTYGDLTDTIFGTIEFAEAGEYDIKVEHTGTAGQYVGDIFFIHLGSPIEIASVTAGDADLTETDVISVATDVIMVNFSKLIRTLDITGKDSKISLKDSKGNAVAFIPSVVKGSAVLTLKETLKLGETYKLSVGSISDSVEASQTKAVEYIFTTEEGEGKAFVKDASASIENNVITAKATMISSQNAGIKGRTFEAYLEAPDGEVSETPVASGITGEDGAIEFTYTLPSGAENGVYTLIIMGDYVASGAEASVIYASVELRAEIEDALASCENGEAAKNVLKEYKNCFGIDPDKMVSGVKDSSKVFEHFVDSDLTFDEIIPAFEKYIAVETLSQATASDIDDVFDSEEVWAALEINDAVFGVFGNEDIKELKEALLAIEGDLSADEFVEEVNKTIYKALAKVTSKTDLTLSIDDVSAYVGQGIYIPVSFEEEADAIAALVIEAKASDKAILADVDVKMNEEATVYKNVTGDVLTVEIVFNDIVSSKDLGNIILTAPSAPDSFSIELSGNVVYLCSNEISKDNVVLFTFATDILNDTIQIGVSALPSSSNGSTSSTPSSNYRPSTGSSSGGGGGASTVVPPVPETFKFTDIASNHWAYPAVEYLTNINVIDKTADKKFNPEKATAREEIVKMLVIALGLTDTTAESTLKDVAITNPYYVYIASAEKNGIIKGDDLGNFNIGASLTREDVCVILHRAISSKLGFTSSGDKFIDDAVISDYAKAAVYDMRGAGLINGMGNNEFAPKGNVTKAQAAKMIYEIVKAVAK